VTKLLKEQEVPWKFIIATSDAFEPFKDNSKTLGIKKFMPNKKSKTLIDPVDLENKLKELCKGVYEVKNDSGKNINTLFGRKKLTYNELNDNLRYLIETISSKKAATVKGNLIKAAYISFKKGKSYLLHQKVLNVKSDNYLK
jgi:ribosomal protein L1